MGLRRIIFRGKSKCTGEWLFGDLEYNRKEGIARIHTYDSEGNYEGQEIVDENTIGQFTGIYDANGKEIYDGDIVKDNGIVYKAVEYRESKSAFVMYIIGFEDMWYPLNHFVTVYSNIHDEHGWQHINSIT